MLESLNVGCIPSKAMLNHSHIYHQTIYDIKKRGIDEPPTDAQSEGRLRERSHEMYQILFKQNKADYFKGTASFVCPNTISVQLIEGGESTVEVKNIIIAKGSEVAPLPGGTIGKVPEKMVVIGGGIIGLEMGIVWSRLGAEVTVVEFLNCIGGAGIEKEISKQFQKSLMKQHLKYKSSTKVLSAEQKDVKVAITTEAAKDGKRDSLKADVVLFANGRRPYMQGLDLENVGVGVDLRGHIVIDDQFNASVPNIKHIGDVTFGLMLAHEAEEEGIAGVEYIHSGHGHVNYGTIPSVVYTHPEVAWVGKTEQELKTDGVKYKARGKFLVEAEMDWILGVHIVGPNAGEMIAKGVLALEYTASAENIAPRTHAHICPSFLGFHLVLTMTLSPFFSAVTVRGVPRSSA
ncbi:dihydrolipoyl dehydrogenase [Lactarius indigo]|nr:dihydrolipoyl dehydrogenase [Lactarius indigo]